MNKDVKVSISPQLDVSTNGVMVFIKSFAPSYNSTMVLSIDELEKIVKFVRENSKPTPELLTISQLNTIKSSK